MATTGERVEARALDLNDPDNWVQRVPHDGFDWLRQHDPVSFHERGDGTGFWALITYEDVAEAGKDWQTFSSLKGFTIDDAVGGAELMMTSMDPPRHNSIRRLVNQGFTPRRVARIEEHVRDIATQLIDRVAPRGECDFVVDLAAELPLQVILEMIGVPPEDRHRCFQWSNTMLGLDDPEYGNSMEKATQAAMEMYMYWEWLASQRREERRDDLIGALIEAELGDEKLTNQEIDAFLLLLVVAGNETTRNLISGGMYTLLQNRDQWEDLVADPGLLTTGVEEMLRYISPVMYFRRTATRDVEMRGKTIREGDKITLWFIAANRDPEVFPDPHRFDVKRTPNEHVAFGAGGPHYCLGSNLARLEIRVMFEELLKRTPDIEQAGDIARLRSNFISGVKHMPVKFTPERA
jgi:cholest-4-en-3-one 26-monooxygenase